MKVQVIKKDQTSRIYEVERVKYFSKNPCLKCRPDGGCYDHGCFNPEDWGDFLDLGKDEIKVTDIKTIRIISI